MIIRRQVTDQNLVINTEQDFQTDLGWESNLMQFEEEVLKDIVNPIENYETVRYIHCPYTSSGVTQTDIWFYFYFIGSGGTYVQDYQAVGISNQENEQLLPQSTKSFFRLELFKTPGNVVNNVLTCDPPTRQNRKLVFAKNLSLPIGEKVFDPVLRGNLHIPVFTGSNYRNKENMYMFWFADESVLTETNLSGSTTGNTFFMTAKFYDAENGDKLDFTNDCFLTGHTVNESKDMYYQVDIDKRDYSYKIYKYSGTTKGEPVGLISNPIKFYEKGGAGCPSAPVTTPTPTITRTPATTPIGPLVSPTTTPTLTPTPTPPSRFYLYLERCDMAPHDPSGTGWTHNSYLQTECQVGDVFYSAGGFYYVVANYNIAPQGGTLYGSKNTSGYTSCNQTPGHYVAPVYRTAHFLGLFRYSGYTSYTDIMNNMCGYDPSQMYPNITETKSGVYLDATVSGTTPTPGVLYNTLYLDNIDGSAAWTNTGTYWWGAIVYNTHSQVDYIVRIDNGSITEWRDCSTGNIIYS